MLGNRKQEGTSTSEKERGFQDAELTPTQALTPPKTEVVRYNQTVSTEPSCYQSIRQCPVM